MQVLCTNDKEPRQNHASIADNYGITLKQFSNLLQTFPLTLNWKGLKKDDSYTFGKYPLFLEKSVKILKKSYCFKHFRTPFRKSDTPLGRTTFPNSFAASQRKTLSSPASLARFARTDQELLISCYHLQSGLWPENSHKPMLTLEISPHFIVSSQV